MQKAKRSKQKVKISKQGKENYHNNNIKELRSYLMDLGRKRSVDITDDVPNTQQSNTGTKKQKKGKQNMTNSNKRN
ncbi:hypothetical protein V6N11_037573 [Hibiscus sabdariffa]|uniref:Uncharacterized protein n=1 Tax=Hibiscus sabdariffa TaxID=183260 RepID=A0ABR1ZCA5_9ROSI